VFELCLNLLFRHPLVTVKNAMAYTENIPPYPAVMDFGDLVHRVDSGQQKRQPPPTGAESPHCPAQASKS